MLKAEGITKSYGNKAVLDNISFSIESGEFVSVVGESGCGKTTLLKIIIGLIPIPCGKIELNGVDITHNDISERGMGIVFQNFALFPNMTVLKNVELPLLMHKQFKKQARQRAQEFIDLVGLSEHMHKKPHMLSGGQCQRAALARMLALDNKVLLLDEPFSALDIRNRAFLREELRAMQKKLSLMVIYITHDIEETLSVSDRVIILGNSVIQQFDTPLKLIRKPANDYVRKFFADSVAEKHELLQSYFVKEL